MMDNGDDNLQDDKIKMEMPSIFEMERDVFDRTLMEDVEAEQRLLKLLADLRNDLKKTIVTTTTDNTDGGSVSLKKGQNNSRKQQRRRQNGLGKKLMRKHEKKNHPLNQSVTTTTEEQNAISMERYDGLSAVIDSLSEAIVYKRSQLRNVVTNLLNAVMFLRDDSNDGRNEQRTVETIDDTNRQFGDRKPIDDNVVGGCGDGVQKLLCERPSVADDGNEDHRGDGFNFINQSPPATFVDDDRAKNTDADNGSRWIRSPHSSVKSRNTRSSETNNNSNSLDGDKIFTFHGGPVTMLYALCDNIKYSIRITSHSRPQVTYKIAGKKYKTQGRSLRAAKRACALLALRDIFNIIEDDSEEG